jgi:DNA-binding PadR family transcriptional regulator
VLLALLTGASNLSGYPIGRVAQVGSGRVYKALGRLEQLGLVDTGWSEDNPRRRLYRLTQPGRHWAALHLGLEFEEVNDEANP